MDIVEFIFGPSPARRMLRRAPARALWTRIRARPQAPVRAHLAETKLDIHHARGVFHARAGEDMVVRHDDGDCAVVRHDIFERTYQPLGGDLYQKRDDVVLRYFTLRKPVVVDTIEGPQRAEAGDWIIEGVAGELWPVAKAKALERYEPL